MKFLVKEHRKARGWSQEQLAELAGTSKGYVSQIENGRRDPSAETLRSLAAALEVEPAELISGSFIAPIPDRSELGHSIVVQGPEPQSEVKHVYERLHDLSRQLQQLRNEISHVRPKTRSIPDMEIIFDDGLRLIVEVKRGAVAMIPSGKLKPHHLTYLRGLANCIHDLDSNGKLDALSSERQDDR